MANNKNTIDFVTGNMSNKLLSGQISSSDMSEIHNALIQQSGNIIHRHSLSMNSLNKKQRSLSKYSKSDLRFSDSFDYDQNVNPQIDPALGWLDMICG